MFHTRTIQFGRLKRMCIIAQALLVVAVPVLLFHGTGAAPLTNRSVRLDSPIASATTAHTFQFSLGTSGTLGSIQIEYCSNNPFVGTACVAPAGLSLTGASIGSQFGVSDFTIHPNSTANNLILTRTPSAVAAQPVTYIIDNVVNPSTPTSTTFVRISTYVTDDATGAYTDEGAVLFSTSVALSTNGYVPPYLTFCVGITVANDCTNAVGNALDLGELSINRANTATSQFAGATNDENGYTVSLAGTTMTSGNNVINPLDVPTLSAPGTSQYGINLRANTAPAVGQNPLGSGTSTPTADFNVVNRFTFKNGTLTTSPLPTNFNTFTVSYLVNVPNGQPPGVYSTTATYIAVALF